MACLIIHIFASVFAWVVDTMLFFFCDFFLCLNSVFAFFCLDALMMIIYHHQQQHRGSVECQPVWFCSFNPPSPILAADGEYYFWYVPP